MCNGDDIYWNLRNKEIKNSNFSCEEDDGVDKIEY